jgi:hypothetical protein
MPRFLICLTAAAALSLASLPFEPAAASARAKCVEGGYGLGWYGGRPYYYRPFGVYGDLSCPDGTRPQRFLGKRSDNRKRSYNR